MVLRRPGGFTLDVTLRVEHGEVIALLGPNGSGKSTVLGVLAGLLLPDSGHIRLGEAVIADVATGVRVPVHRRGIGLLAQRAMLFPHLTAVENVAFGPRMNGTPRKEAKARARELLGEVGVAPQADRRPAQMSGGQQQRVALARALAPSPELLLLDEPLAALDVDTTPAMRSLLRRMIRDMNQTAVLVTHSALDALMLADRVVVLTDGKVVEQGPTNVVLGRPRSPFTARIAGLNLVPGTRHEDTLRTYGGRLLLGEPNPTTDGDDHAVAVFPPSAVAVSPQPPPTETTNVVAVRLAAIEPHGNTMRLLASAPDGGEPWIDGLSADVTPATVVELGAEPGVDLWFHVNPAEVAIYAATG